MSETVYDPMNAVDISQKYLGVNYADARVAVESIALITTSDRNHLLSNSIKETDDHTLITELRKRGYKLSDLRENETKSEIVKIS